MENFYSLEVKKIFKGAEVFMRELNHPYVGTEHLLLSLLKNSKSTKEILAKYDLTFEKFMSELNNTVGATNKKVTVCVYTPLLKKVIKLAKEISVNKEITGNDLLEALIEEGEGIAMRILINMDIDIDKIYEELRKKENKYNNKLEIFKIGKDLQKYVAKDDILVGRDEELKLIIETLIRKNKNNPLLVGDAGVGKSAIIEELARRINNGNVPNGLKNKRIVSLEMASLVSGTKYRGEFEEKLGKIIKEIEDNPDIILFVDEMHTITNAGGAEGAINASDILKPYLARGKIKIIGATTTNEYNKYILKDKALTRRFELIKIKEPSINETKEILYKLIPSFEKFYNLKINHENIDKIVNITDKYVLNRYNPDKSIDLLDSVCAMKCVDLKKDDKINNLILKKENIIKKKEKMVYDNNFQEAAILRSEEIKLLEKINCLKKSSNIITSNDIELMFKRKNNIPLVNEEILLEGLEDHLKNVIIGQDEQIEKIIGNLKSKEDGIPISILLTGSTGVGKTQTVKEISKFLSLPLIRLDMSEYNSDITINRLIGASAGYVGYDDDTVFDKIKVNSKAVVLVDELEKAHPSVINLFLQILDEGFVTNTKGEKIDFKNTYIFMTSNAEACKKIGFIESRMNYQNNFSKEFLARITDIIAFNNIDEEMIQKFLRSRGIENSEIISDYDYQSLGFRGLDRYLKKQKIF